MQPLTNKSSHYIRTNSTNSSQSITKNISLSRLIPSQLDLSDTIYKKSDFIYILSGLLMMKKEYLREESSDSYQIEQQEDNDDDLSISEKEPSSLNGKKTYQTIKTRQLEPSIKYHENNWLIKLIEMNPLKMKQIIDWINTLVDCLSGKMVKQTQHISYLNFENIDSNRQVYFISIFNIDQYFYILKIQDASGLTFSFRVCENNQKESNIQEILKKMGRKMPIYIIDYTDNVSYFNQIFTKHNNPANIVAVIKESLCLHFKRVGKWRYVKGQMNGTKYRYYYNFLKKIFNICQTVENFQATGASNSEEVWKILNRPSELLSTTESRCLLSNIITSFQQELSKQQLIKILNDGIEQVEFHQNKWSQSSSNHFPGAGTTRKCICSHCHRKKSEIICKGCSMVYERQINLCIGPCFQKFHEDHQMFMKKQVAQVCKNVVFFDKKCKEIGGLLDILIEEQNVDYLQFVNYLQAKMISSLNTITLKQSDIESDQIQTND